jgi:hypothetical protein
MLEILHAGLERNKNDFDQKIIIFQLQIFKKWMVIKKLDPNLVSGFSKKPETNTNHLPPSRSPLFVSLFSLPLKQKIQISDEGLKMRYLKGPSY